MGPFHAARHDMASRAGRCVEGSRKDRIITSCRPGVLAEGGPRGWIVRLAAPKLQKPPSQTPAQGSEACAHRIGCRARVATGFCVTSNRVFQYIER